ncbi:hypothetical protein D9758_009852 [Tetrapyrgos nigripes]|uniref:GST N-terminal domain-containing protein n=1 Tax=Tetrapyrgos nigripes TaxID=182062 RepID=A0A8H5GMC5_9AGAR|nr:hypothetical protein D9758_009852 [Tetrapyrgos nigripes]
MITLYDNKSTLPLSHPYCGYSPYVWRIRFALRFKGLAYRTHWLEYPDVETIAKSIGAPPTGKRPNGTVRYTIPIIHDSVTNKVISGSFDIIEYLDATYPDTVQLIPKETRLLQKVFEEAEPGLIIRHLIPVVGSRLHKSPLITPRNQEFMNSEAGRASYPPPVVYSEEQEKEAWEKFKNSALGDMAKQMLDSEEAPFVMGKKVSMADAVLFGRFACLRLLWDESTKEWKEMMSWHGGRWGRLFEAYESLPQVEKYDG